MSGIKSATVPSTIIPYKQFHGKFTSVVNISSTTRWDLNLSAGQSASLKPQLKLRYPSERLDDSERLELLLCIQASDWKMSVLSSDCSSIGLEREREREER